MSRGTVKWFNSQKGTGLFSRKAAAKTFLFISQLSKERV